ncbi:hypothetical protein [Qipengyuania sp. DGS5-3]|uniref:hypothetical protein n=1 Tax=Qipengyuania sp. DGS5-3 TaxID=3349632 RepID=UPI0036D3CCD7
MATRSPLIAALALAMSFAAPAIAQSTNAETEVVRGVAFYETFRIGDMQLIPAAISRDTRCGDPRVSFCLNDGRFDVSFVALSEPRGRSPGFRREVVLSLGKPTRVQGGTLTLIDVGAEPALRGARPLQDYALAVLFEPDERR